MNVILEAYKDEIKYIGLIHIYRVEHRCYDDNAKTAGNVRKPLTLLGM